MLGAVLVHMVYGSTAFAIQGSIPLALQLNLTPRSVKQLDLGAPAMSTVEKMISWLGWILIISPQYS